MTPERWQQVDNLLQAAMEQPAAARAAFLQAACASDTELLKEVESLLSYQDSGDEFLEAPPAAVAAELLEQGTAELLLGRKLGRYELQRTLGRGGMGAVYLALDLQLDRQVALKLLPRRFTSDAARVRRFRQEARAISALNHPNILTIHEIGEAVLPEGSLHFLATEFVAGQTLRARLQSGNLTLGEVLDAALQTASALVAAHQAGIVHRDIKPENIMLRPDGLIKVLDFGLAKLTGAQTKTPAAATFSTIHTNPGIVMGTVSYMSPEQARGLEVDGRSDIFSLGVVLYEMLIGRPPFAGATTGDVLVSILDREPKPLASLAPALPAALQQIINRALAKDTNARYQQALELHNDLKGLKQELELAARLHRSGGTSAGVVSLSLPVGQSAEPIKGVDLLATRDSVKTKVASLPSWRHQLLAIRRPFKLVSSTYLLLAGLALVLAGAAIYRYWPGAEIARDKTIAVLPFSNANADPELDYLPDGVTESLMQSLQQLPNLRVMARGAVFAYKGHEVDPRKVGKDLKVDAILMGRVQRQGNQLHITVELVDARDGTVLWSEKYPRPLDEMQAVQTEIAREITSKLRLQLSGAQQKKMAARYTQNGEAYDLYLLGRYHWNKRTPDGVTKSVEYFRQASEKDPGFALAYVGLADAYNILVAYRMRSPLEAGPRARAAAERALQIDEQLADAHASMGKLLTDYYAEWEASERQFKRALELNPNLANAYHWYSSLLASLGRFDEAVQAAQRADDLDAHAPATSTQLGSVLYRARRYDEALSVLHQTLTRNPGHVTAHIYITLCYMLQARYDEALTELYRAEKLAPGSPDIITMFALVYGRTGQLAEVRRCQAELNAVAGHTYVSPGHYSAIAAGLGDMDTYFAWMEKSLEQGSPMIRGLKTDPIYDEVRKDPRFEGLLQRAGFAP
jgi:eukaryotic-like serine/threonine-protein kinase